MAMCQGIDGQLRHKSDYIFWSFWISQLIRGRSQYTIPLKDELGGVNSVSLTITAMVMNRLNKTESGSLYSYHG